MDFFHYRSYITDGLLKTMKRAAKPFKDLKDKSDVYAEMVNAILKAWSSGDMEFTHALGMPDFSAQQKLLLGLRMKSETAWHNTGRPYVKVFPGMAAYLSRTKLEIPSEFIKPSLPAFAIRLEDSPDNVIEYEAGDTLQSGLCSLVAATEKDYGFLVMTLQTSQRMDRGDATFVVPLTPGHTLERCIEEANYMDADRPFVRNAAALIVSVNCFLQGNHELVAPDIIRREIHKYEDAKLKGDQKAIDDLVEKSKREGCGWYKLGQEIELPGELVTYHKNPDGEGMRGELNWSHMRRMHMRLQPYGPRDKPQYKAIYILPVRVRPDLPLKPSTGYCIKDSSLPK